MNDLASDANRTRVDTEYFPCQSCGANMTFDTESHSLSCPYCSNNLEIANEDCEIIEYDLETAELNASQDWGNTNRVIHCENCGAETVLDEFTTAKFCPFCSSSHIAKVDDSAGIVPAAIIPFSISREEATDEFSKWIKSQLLAPKTLKDEHQIEHMTGIYIPKWTYDTHTHSTYRALAGYYYYENETYTVKVDDKTEIKTRRVRRTDWKPVSGIFTEYFDDLLINASKNIDEELFSEIAPFHLADLVPYKAEYLSGFLAERYSISLLDGWEQVKEFSKNEIRGGITEHIHADQLKNLKIHTEFNNIKFKQILLPVWVCSYSYKEKVYHYLINGQTGEVQGHAPISSWKVLLTILSVLGVIFLLYFWISNGK